MLKRIWRDWLISTGQYKENGARAKRYDELSQSEKDDAFDFHVSTGGDLVFYTDGSSVCFS